MFVRNIFIIKLLQTQNLILHQWYERGDNHSCSSCKYRWILVTQAFTIPWNKYNIYKYLINIVKRVSDKTNVGFKKSLKLPKGTTSIKFGGLVGEVVKLPIHVGVWLVEWLNFQYIWGLVGGVAKLPLHLVAWLVEWLNFHYIWGPGWWSG